MPEITFADISEFQDNFIAEPYLQGGHQVILVRTYNGHRPDYKMPARRDYVRVKPFVAVGYYCYLVASVDPVTQARAFIDTIGALAPNEFPILDHEEGGGNQVPRAEAFLAVVDRWAGFQTTLYAGRSFLAGALGGTGRWGRRPLWIADYFDYTSNPVHEPRGATFWQYSSRERFPGLSGGVDASIYRGTAQAFLARVRPGAGLAGPSAPHVGPEDELVVATRPDGHTELFVHRRSGEVSHAWQSASGAAWTGWHSLGKPGG
jgi:hypothetical protein